MNKRLRIKNEAKVCDLAEVARQIGQKLIDEGYSFANMAIITDIIHSVSMQSIVLQTIDERDRK